MENRLRPLENVTYSIGSLGREISNNCINVFFLAYLNIYMGLDALVLTIAFVLAKAWDTINDPILATLVNNTKKGKWGRFRPWMAVGAILNAASVILMFTPLSADTSIGLKYFYYIAMYVIWGMTFTLVDVPFWSMIPAIANDTEDRNKISSLAKLIGGFGGFVITSIGTSVILANFIPKYGWEKAYLILGVAAGLMMACFMSVTIMCNKEKYDLPNEKVGLGEIFRMFKSNDQLVAYAISYVFFVSATTISLFQMLYLFVYCYPNGANYFSSSYSYTVFTAVACTGQGIAMFFYNLITKKLPREKLYGANYFMAIIGMIAMFFIFFALKPGNHLLNTIIVALCGAFLMTANGLNQIGSTVMIADVVDYGEWKTGKRGDSVIFSVQTLLTKFAGAIAMLILGVGIKVAKLPNVVETFDEVTGKWAQFFADDAGNILNASDLISGNALTILRVFMFLVPVPLCIIGYIVYKKKYNLYGERYDKIKAEIDQRRLEHTEKVDTGMQNQPLDTTEETAQEIIEAACDTTDTTSGEVQ
ncbi:MAG: MFS transporter [Christensenellales bacterium]